MTTLNFPTIVLKAISLGGYWILNLNPINIINKLGLQRISNKIIVKNFLILLARTFKYFIKDLSIPNNRMFSVSIKFMIIYSR